MNLTITGTSTGVGKTYFTCALLRALKAAGIRACGYKPFCSGPRDDVAALLAESAPTDPPTTEDEVNPFWFKAPFAPLAAAMMEGKPIDLDTFKSGFETLAARFDSVLIEGVGGWEVPLCPGENFGDYAAELGLPVVVVADNRLGALNHTILTVNAIRARGLTCHGIVLTYTEEERDGASISNAAVLDVALPGVPVLLDLMHGETEIEVGPFLG